MSNAVENYAASYVSIFQGIGDGLKFCINETTFLLTRNYLYHHIFHEIYNINPPVSVIEQKESDEKNKEENEKNENASAIKYISSLNEDIGDGMNNFESVLENTENAGKEINESFIQLTENLEKYSNRLQQQINDNSNQYKNGVISVYIHKLKIGNVELANNIILAPMAGVSDLP